MKKDWVILLQYGPLSRTASHMRSQLMFAASLTDGCTTTSWCVRALSLIVISFLYITSPPGHELGGRVRAHVYNYMPGLNVCA